MEMAKSSYKNIAVFLSGRGSDFKSILCNIDKINGDIKIAVSNRNAPGLNYAKQRNIETIIENDFSKILQKMKDLDIDLIVLAGFIKIIPKDFIDEFEGKIINIHPSLIPSFCGKDFYGDRVHEAVIKRGVKFTGCTTHFVTDIPDGGPIILQKIVKVEQDDDKDSIAKKVLDEEHKLLPETVRLFCDDRLIIKGNKVLIR